MRKEVQILPNIIILRIISNIRKHEFLFIFPFIIALPLKNKVAAATLLLMQY